MQRRVTNMTDNKNNDEIVHEENTLAAHSSPPMNDRFVRKKYVQ